MKKGEITDGKEVKQQSLVVRKLTPEDAIQYNALRLEALRKNPKNFACSYEEENGKPLSEVAKRLATGTYLGIFDGDALIGTVALTQEELLKMNHKGDVREMYVDESKRSRGIGKKLLEALFVEAKAKGIKELQLTVAAENAPAVKLYQSMGFTIWGTERNALKTPEGGFIDELHMSRKMDADPAVVDSKVEQTRDKLTDAGGEATKGMLPSRYLNAFKGRETYPESQMRDAVIRLNELISGNATYASLWADAWSRAEDFNSRVPNYSHEILTGNSSRVSVWVSSSTRHLAEILERSTFSDLGNARQVEKCFTEAVAGNHYSLLDLARHLMSALDAKVFQNAALDIQKERELRLAKAFGLESVFQIIPAHRHQYVGYETVTQEQLSAYLNGDRSEKVFGIGEWTHSDLADGHNPIASPMVA